MTTPTRQLILRAHAIYLGMASAASFLMLDLRGLLLGSGPMSRVINDTPHTAIGFVEAHGLAFILAVLFWRAAPTRFWHLTGAATAGLLGICNLTFWEGFIAADALAIGYVATALHLSVAAAQLAAAVGAKSDRAVEQDVTGIALAR